MSDVDEHPDGEVRPSSADPSRPTERPEEPANEGDGLPPADAAQGVGEHSAAGVAATGWSEPSAAASVGSEDRGWPTPWTGSDSGPLALPPGDSEPESPPAAPHAPRGQSRNPVDRLTRGLPTPCSSAWN